MEKLTKMIGKSKSKRVKCSRFSLVFWFLKRPTHWSHMFELIRRKFRVDYDTPELRAKAGDWASKRAISYEAALKKVGIDGEIIGLDELIECHGKQLVARCTTEMGGPGHLDLLFDVVRLTKARKVIETGVAYGWSSLAILHGQLINGGAGLSA